MNDRGITTNHQCPYRPKRVDMLVILYPSASLDSILSINRILDDREDHHRNNKDQKHGKVCLVFRSCASAEMGVPISRCISFPGVITCYSATCSATHMTRLCICLFIIIKNYFNLIKRIQKIK